MPNSASKFIRPGDPGNPTSIATMVDNMDTAAGAHLAGFCAEGENGGRKVYDTPPGSFAEAVSPSTSKNRGQLRAASLGISPSLGRSKGLGTPSPSFGAGVAKVPAPIFTKLQGSLSGGMHSQNMREPDPVGGLPSIAQTLDRGADGSYPHVVPASHILRSSFGKYGESVGAPNGYDVAESNDPFDINPYAHRADEIGPSHHIPGLGLLDDLLQPPGWKEGDEPIDPRKARFLFNEQRTKAKNTFKASVEETKHLPAEEQEKRSNERKKQWDVQFKLDQLLLTERIFVHDLYQERKNKKLRQGHLNKSTPTKTLLPIEPQPVNTMTSVPARLQSMYSKSASSSPDVVDAGLPQHGMYGADRGLPGSRYLRSGSPGFLSPTLLDPSLLPSSLDAAYRTYQVNQFHIVQMKANNERFLCNSVAKYGPFTSQGQISPSMLPPVTGQQARPFFSVHNGYVHQEQNGYPSPGIPRPPPYQSPLQQGTTADSQQGRPFHQQGRGYPACNTQVDSDERLTRDGQYPARSNGRESSFTNRNVSQNQTGSERQVGQVVEHDEEEVTPKKRASRAKGAKKEPWYAAQLAAANLPNAVISAEAMQAGLNWAGSKEGASIQKSPAKPRRRAKPIIDPKKGMAISEATAKVLIANGATDKRPKPVGAASSATPVIVHNLVGASSATNDQSAGIPPLNPTPSEANFIFSRTNQVATEPTTEASTDHADDPNDAYFGRRSIRRKIPTARKMDNAQNDTPANKKRKSDGPSVGNKRTRLDGDGPGDEAEHGADQNTGDEE